MINDITYTRSSQIFPFYKIEIFHNIDVTDM